MRRPRMSISNRTLALLTLLALTSAVSASNDTQTCENVRHAADRCQFVRDHCQEDRLGFFDYLEVYYCAASPVAGGFFLSSVMLWLCVLFMVIGIAASDYLCPNLNTISKMLGLSESLAGVTFLALGNGSPDVFSTYAAMKIGSGSLAVGELIGAASFITAVVTGAMAIIRPFKVARKSFLRDVIFFTVAIACSMYFVSDGVLKLWECATMLGIYVLYVIFVVAWHWYNSRRRYSYLVETRARDFYTEPGHETRIEADEEITDNPSLLTQGLNFGDFNSPLVSPRTEHPMPFNPSATSSPISPLTAPAAWQDQSEEDQEEAYSELTRIMRLRRIQQRTPNFRMDPPMASPSGSSPSPIPIRTSLFGAMEFRNVLQRLETARASSATSIPLEATRNSDFALLSSAEDHSAISQPDNRVRSLSLPAYTDSTTSATPTTDQERRVIPHVIITDVHNESYEPVGYDSSDYERATSPSLHRYSDDPDSVHDSHASVEFLNSPQRVMFPGQNGMGRIKSKFAKIFSGWGDVITTVCPTLTGIREKSLINQIMCVITAPAIFLLTVTVPVIESEAIEKEISSGTSEPQGLGLFLTPEKTKVYIPITRWLIILQALLGPLFVAFSAFAEGGTSLIALALYSATVSAVILLLIFFLVPESTRAPIYMQSLSFVGFVIAISWVSLVANEVVGILKALGVIFHISDAVLGLTVFAVGNSLGDLVANMTVAKMGFPMMALSACFGGPMLNILVGVGVSGIVVMPPGGFPIELSYTLVISGITLMVTLMFLLVSVPLNNWKLSRTLGTITVLFWIIATTVNVILEITT